MKKLAIVALLALTLTLIAACGDDDITLTYKVDGESVDTRTLEEPGTAPTLAAPDAEGKHFLGWHLDEDFTERVGFDTEFDSDTTLHARLVEDDGELDTLLTDELEIPDYEGKDFFEDGIGEVELKACRDGDTADFTDGENDFRVRYLGLDTPESGHLFEPWGPPASAVACEMKQEADALVLERDEAAGDRGTYGRELAYVWVDGRLLNLELIEKAYSPAEGVGQLKYGYDMQLADQKASSTDRRLHGEDDPDFIYDEAIDTDIPYLLENYDTLRTQRVNLEGIVQSKIDDHFFLQSLDGEAGIFFYVGYENTHVEVGDHLSIENAQVYHDGKGFEGLHLTAYNQADITTEESGLEVHIEDASIGDLSFEDTGLRFHFSDLEIVDIDVDAFRFTVEDDSGETIDIVQLQEPPLLNDQQHSLLPNAHRIELDALEVGDVLSGTLNVTEIDGEVVLTPSHRDDVEIDGMEEGLYYEPKDLDYDGPALDAGFFDLTPYEYDAREEACMGTGGAFEVTYEAGDFPHEGGCIDGDTTLFTDYPDGVAARIESNTPSVRYLNLDAPETFPEGEEEEWGRPATEYVCDALKDAESIVLQTDPGDELTGVYGRLLGWVWVRAEGETDYELLNYRVIRQGLSTVGYEWGAGETDVTVYEEKTYNEWMRAGETRAASEGLGMHGGWRDYYWDYENDAPHPERW